MDFFLSERRDMTAAKRFFEQAVEKRGVPQKITLDGSAASHEAVAELQEDGTLPEDLTVRTNQYLNKLYLNNLIEQDHHAVKQRVAPMLGFKGFASAVVTITGIASVHQIKKGQFDRSAICSAEARAPYVWEAVLAA